MMLSAGTIYKGQQFGVIAIGMFIVAWMMDNIWFRAFLIYTTLWMVWLLVVAGTFSPGASRTEKF